MRYGCVCSGIGAATRAWQSLGWEAQFFSEIEGFPSAVLAHHYGSNMPGKPLSKNGIPNHGDFTKIGPEAGPIDLLVGGTPCQSFSIAGKRLGLDDPRGNLALEYLSLAVRLRARWIVWENVPGVLSSYSGSEQTNREVSEGPVGGLGDGIEERDFAMFLSFVRECGYGFAYRVLDSQYVRVDGFGRAVPQRRRRVFVVGYLGDWRRAAAVLLEPQGMRGDSAPRREPGKRVAGTIASRTSGGGGLGTDFELDGGLTTVSSSGSVPHCLNAGGMGRQDYETETMVAHPLRAQAQHSHRLDSDNDVVTKVAHEVAETLTSNGDAHSGFPEAAGLVAHSLRAEGFDASEDGTGRGTPIVPVPYTLAIQAGALRENPNSGPDGVGVQEGISYTLEARAEVQAVAFDTTQITSKANYSNPQIGDPCHPLASGAHPPAVAIQAVCHPTHEVVGTLCAEDSPHGGRGLTGLQTMLSGYIQPEIIKQQWAVRRLTPMECERLQGFPDNFTNVPWGKKKTSPDGPRYKALGNSMSVNTMRWIGLRIEMVEALTEKEMAA